MESKADLLDGNPYLINRVVGFHEYTQALKRLSRFVRLATVEELSAAELIVEDEEQYSVFGLYGDVKDNRKKQRQSKADNKKKSFENQQYDYDLERGIGLARILALARVESAAMLAGFTKHQSPFEAVSPTEYELKAFTEFVFEGARAQFESIQADQVAHTEFPPSQLTLALMRRLNIARHFIVAAAILSNLEGSRHRQQIEVAGTRRDTPEEVRKLQIDYPENPAVHAQTVDWLSMKSTLDRVYEPFEAAVYAYLNTMAKQQVAANTEITQQYLQACRDGICGGFADVNETPTTFINHSQQTTR